MWGSATDWRAWRRVCGPSAGCRRQLDRCPAEDPDTMVNVGCVMFKEGHYEAARQKFVDAMGIVGYQVRAGGRLLLPYTSAHPHSHHSSIARRAAAVGRAVVMSRAAALTRA